MVLFALAACSPVERAEDTAAEAVPDCSTEGVSLRLGSFPEGTTRPWVTYEDGVALCFRTGPCGNGSTWPEVRVTGRSGRGRVTARLVQDQDLLFETVYEEVMSRPSDDLCAYTTHFYLWLPVDTIEAFDDRPATLGVLYEDLADSDAPLLQDTVTVVPTVCNPEDAL